MFGKSTLFRIACEATLGHALPSSSAQAGADTLTAEADEPIPPKTPIEDDNADDNLFMDTD